MLDKYYSVLLPNKNRFCDKAPSNSRNSSASAIVFGIYGIKSKDSVSILNIDTNYQSLSYMIDDENFLIKKIIGDSKKVFVVYTGVTLSTMKQYVLIFKRALARYGVKVFFVSVEEIRNTIPNYNIYHYFYELMLIDNSFQISSIAKIREEMKVKNQLELDENHLKNTLREKEIIENKNKSKVSSSELIIGRIKNMGWIERIKTSGDGLLIKTKQMQMRYVPNVGKYLETCDIINCNVFYKIFKNQCLGYNFILLPEEYLVPYNFNIKGVSDESNRNKLLTVAGPLTYFKGANPHIGPSGSCYGEFSSAIASAQDNGLDFLLMSFLPYLLSANLNDSAGKTVCYLPMGDKDGNITCWPFIDELLRLKKIPYRGQRTENTYLKWLQKPEVRNIILEAPYKRDIIYPSNISCHNESEERLRKNLLIIEQREPEVYKRIMARIEKGERL